MRFFTVFALAATFSPALALPLDGARTRDAADPAAADPPRLQVSVPEAEVRPGAEWQIHDISALCGVQSSGRLQIEEVSGDDAAAAAQVALEGPTTLRLRAPAGTEHQIVVEFSATNGQGHQAFDRCQIRLR